MRVAVCMSGHMRTYEKAYENQYKNIFQELNPDIFLSSWEDNTTNWKDVLNMYSPVAHQIENPIEFPDPYPNKHITSSGKPSNQGVLGMYYKIHQCNSLKTNHEKIAGEYDYVIRMRPDLVLNKKITPEDLKKTKDVIGVSSKGSNVWLSDTFAISTSEKMNFYSNCYIHLSTLYKKNKSLHPEMILKNYLDTIWIKTIINNANTAILRSDDRVIGHDFDGSLEKFTS